MESSDKAALDERIRVLESEMDVDHGDAGARSWRQLVAWCEEIEAIAYDTGITTTQPKPIWQPQYLTTLENGYYDYITPYNRIIKAIRTRLATIKKRLPAPKKQTRRNTTWAKLREHLESLPELPATYKDRLAASKSYNQKYAHHFTKATKKEVDAAISYIRKQRRKHAKRAMST